MDIASLQDEVEAVSTYYAETFGIDRSDDWFMLKLGEEVGELTQAFLAKSGRARDKGRSEAQLEGADDARWVITNARHLLDSLPLG